MKRKVRRIGPIQRREIRLAFLLLFPTLLIVLLIVFLPLFINIWISFKSILLSDLRPPTAIVNERVRGDLTKVNEEISIEYRVRNSSTKEELREVVIADVIPLGLRVVEVDDNCSMQERNVSCEFTVFPAKNLERIKLIAVVEEEFFNDPVNPKDSSPSVSLVSRNKLTDFVFTLENYKRMLAGEEFFNVLKVTFIYTIFGTAGALFLGLLAALLLNEHFLGRGFFRGLFLFPYVSPIIAVAFTWVIIFDPFSGMFNTLLLRLSLIDEAINFFGQRYADFSLLGYEFKFPLALASVILFESWRYFPLSFLFILARMQSIDKEMFEAAKVDGASPLQSFWYISLPQLLGIFALLFLLRFIWTFNKFDDIFLLTGGAAGTRTLTVDVYEQGFAIANLGAGAAVALVIFLLLLTFSIFFLKFSPQDK